MRRAALRKRRQAVSRARGRERAKRWRVAHPERARAYQERWVQENRAKVREYYNRYYAAHRDDVSARSAARRDADPEHAKQAQKQWAERNKERRAELQRSRRSDSTIYQSELEANAAARRLKRSLSRAGLPPKSVHPTTAAERRTNEREASAYFRDPALPERLRQFTVLAESLTEHMLKNGDRMREFAESYSATRARAGLPPVDTENVIYARAVEVVAERMRRVDLLTSRDVAAAVRGTRAAVRHKERELQFERLVKAVLAHVQRNSAQCIADAELENRARAYRGNARMPVDSLVARLALEVVIKSVPASKLTIEDIRSAARVIGSRIVLPADVRSDSMKHPVLRPPVGR